MSAAAPGLSDFVLSQTTLMSPPLVPEISLHLAADAHRIFAVTEKREADSGWPPYWAFAWPGGQALARHVLDHPEAVRGRRVLDIGAGSGIASIAAALAGAAGVVAADPDPLAATAIAINAAQNGVAVSIETGDALGEPPTADLVMIADLVYEPELAVRVGAFLEAARARGIPVLMADRTTARRPALAFALLGEYRAPLTPMLEESHFEHARVWQLAPARSRAAARGAP